MKINFHVVDSIMGSGKTTAAIGYIEAHPEWKFIYVTPYLNEVKRIKEACTVHAFEEPVVKETVSTKTRSLWNMVHKGQNIVTTHSLFFRQTVNMAELLKDKGYHLIIDESPDMVLKSVDKLLPSEIDYLFNQGIIDIDADNNVSWNLNPRIETHFEDVKSLCYGKRLKGYVAESCGDISRGLFEFFPREVFDAFEDVVVMTYLLDGQIFKAYLQINGIEYDNWYLEGELPEMHFTDAIQPRRFVDYSKLIMIHDGDEEGTVDYRLNLIGSGNFALSKSWYEHSPDKVAQLRRNLYNFFKNVAMAKKKDRMWTTFSDYEDDISGDNRFSKCFVPCNTRATNDYRECNKLAYLVNRFMSPMYAICLSNFDITIDNELFALSEMLQWIWRSAIRDGKPIEIYVPSKRMRGLLESWIAYVKGDTENLTFSKNF